MKKFLTNFFDDYKERKKEKNGELEEFSLKSRIRDLSRRIESLWERKNSENFGIKLTSLPTSYF